jgi:hypothetical protein
MPEYRVTFAGLSVVLWYSNVEVLDFLEFLFNDIHSPIVGDFEAILKISHEGNSDRYTLTSDKEVLFRGYLGVQFAAILFDSVIFNLLNKNSQGVAFHAGAVVFQEKVILLPGRSGSGKSTVSAWLTAHGFSYLTDELVFMPDEKPDMMIPFTRPVCIKSGSVAEINKIIQGDKRFGILEDKEGIIVAHQSLNPDFSIINSFPSLILFPVYQFSAPLRIQRITGAHTCTLLMECDVNARNLADHGFKQIVRITRSIPAYQVAYGCFEGFGDALAELFDELHWN